MAMKSMATSKPAGAGTGFKPKFPKKVQEAKATVARVESSPKMGFAPAKDYRQAQGVIAKNRQENRAAFRSQQAGAAKPVTTNKTAMKGMDQPARKEFKQTIRGKGPGGVEAANELRASLGRKTIAAPKGSATTVAARKAVAGPRDPKATIPKK